MDNNIIYTSTIMRAQPFPTLHVFRKRVTHDRATILDSIAKGTSYFHIFCMVHPYIISESFI